MQPQLNAPKPFLKDWQVDNQPERTMKTDTPRTSKIWGGLLCAYPHLEHSVNETALMEKELTAARAELEAIMETLQSPIEVELDMIRGKIAIPDLTGFDYITPLKAVTEQRDRLQKIVDEQCRVSSVCREYREQRDTTRKLYDVACETAAKMHAAAVGEIKGPHIDPVQDILDLRRERDRLAVALRGIAEQKLAKELDDHTYEHADWEGGWDHIISIARKALAAVKGGSDE
jgi:hypothetical protein